MFSKHIELVCTKKQPATCRKWIGKLLFRSESSPGALRNAHQNLLDILYHVVHFDQSQVSKSDLRFDCLNDKYEYMNNYLNCG